MKHVTYAIRQAMIKNNNITRSIHTEIRADISFNTRWNQKDKGLIVCWETGRQKRISDPDLAEKATNGELPQLGWKGGIDKKIQKNEKYGSLNYLAQWQGLRNQDLEIKTDKETTLTCTKTNMQVTFTIDQSKYQNE